MEKTIVEALKVLGGVYGLQSMKAETASEAILDVAGAIKFGSSNVTVATPTPVTKKYWGTAVQDMQTSISISGGAITGTLHKLTSGQLVTDWGEGYFLALKFTKVNEAITSIKVGLDPSVSSGLVELDEDMDGAFKITDKNEQKFIVRCSDGSVSFDLVFDLSGLTLEA